MCYIVRRHQDEARDAALNLTNQAQHGRVVTPRDDSATACCGGLPLPPPVFDLDQGHEPEEDVLPRTRKLTPEGRRLMLLDMQRAHELVSAEKHEEAKSVLENVAAGLAWAGVTSAHATWARAVVADYLGDGDSAFRLIIEAADMDPLEPAIVRSFGIIVEKLRRTLLASDQDPADESVPRIYGMLIEAGKADDAVHLAMARHLAAVGKDGEAMKLLDAVTTLSPACREAWAAKCALAKKLGLAEEAVAAEAEAASLDGTPVPLFGPPGKAVA